MHALRMRDEKVQQAEFQRAERNGAGAGFGLGSHTQRERIEAQTVDLQDVVAMLVRRAAAQYGADAGMQLARVTRFDDVVVGAGVERGNLGARIAMTGQHDDRQAARLHVGAQGQQHVDRLALGPRPLHQEQLRHGGQDGRLRLARMADPLNIVSTITQGKRQTLPLCLVVFDQQDLNTHFVISPV